MITNTHLPPISFNPVIWKKGYSTMKSALIKHCPDYIEMDNRIDWIIYYESFNYIPIKAICDYAKDIADGIPLVVRSGEDNTRLLLLIGDQLLGVDAWKNKGGTLLDIDNSNGIKSRDIIPDDLWDK